MTEEIDDYITCPQDGCGREARHEEEDYYSCSCGWFGKDILASYKEKIEQLKARLRDAQDLLENCGYCRECFWNRDSIGDIAAHLFQEAYSIGEVPEWPSDCTPLCKSCTVDFKECFTEVGE